MSVGARGLARRAVHAASLSYRDLRLLGASSVSDSIGFVGEDVVLGWLMLQLTDSPFMVGAVLGARMAPSFFLGALAGTIADMVDRLVLMRLLNLMLAAVAAGVGLLIFTDSVQVWHLFVLPPIGGALSTLHMVLRPSYVYDMVGPGRLLGGLAFIGVGRKAGGLVGSLIMGFLMASWGSDIAYFAIASSYLVSTSLLLLMRPRGPASSQEQRVWQNLKRFGVEMRHNSPLLTLVIMTAMVEFAGFSSFVLFPSLARDVFEVGPQGLGVLGAFRSVGGIVALVVVAAIGDQQRKGLAYLVVLLVFGATVLLLGFASTFILAVLIVAAISSMSALSDIYSQSMMQVVVPDELRGRAMGAWLVAAGTGPLGALQIGALASAFTIGFALSANGVALLMLAALSLVLLPRLRRL